MENLVPESLHKIKQSWVIALDPKVGYSISIGNECSAMTILMTEHYPAGRG